MSSVAGQQSELSHDDISQPQGLVAETTALWRGLLGTKTSAQ